MGSEKENKLKALKLTLEKLDKAYGKGTVMKMGDSPDTTVEATHSGSLGLDIALGVGGYPKGRVIEVYGPRINSINRFFYMLSTINSPTQGKN